MQFDSTSELFQALVKPPLVIEAALQLEVHHLRNYLGPIVLLAIPSRSLTTIGGSFIVALGVGQSSPTDCCRGNWP